MILDSIEKDLIKSNYKRNRSLNKQEEIILMKTYNKNHTGYEQFEKVQQ